MSEAVQGLGGRAAPLVFPLALLAASWATWLWAWERWTLPYYSRLGVWPLCGALAAWVYLWATQARSDAQRPDARLIAAASALLFTFSALYSRVPGTLSVQLTMLALGLVLLALLAPAARRGAWGLLPWAMLSVELGPTPEYYLGYPLRVAVAWMATRVLGRGIERSGLSLTDGVHTVLIDAPCSGLRMMTMGLLFASAAAVLLRLTFARTVLLLAAAGLLTVLGNVQRAIVLFYLEPLPHWAHESAGLIAFAGCVVVLLVLGLWLRTQPATDFNPASPRPFPRAVVPIFFIACVAAALAPALSSRATNAVPRDMAFIPWPATLEGERLISNEMPPALQEVFARFAGKAGQFTMEKSGRQVLLRQAYGTTQAMHPSENCYAVQGWRTTPMPAWRDPAGRLWGRFRAEHPSGGVRIVRQCIFAVAPQAQASALEELAANGPHWPDTSAWYWEAARPGAKTFLSLCVTVAESPGMPQAGF